MNLLELSDERDGCQARILAAERRGFDRGWRCGYDTGYTDAVGEIKRVQQQLVRCYRDGGVLWIVRGQVRTRQTFADPHPGDYPGRSR